MPAALCPLAVHNRWPELSAFGGGGRLSIRTRGARERRAAAGIAPGPEKLALELLKPETILCGAANSRRRMLHTLKGHPMSFIIEKLKGRVAVAAAERPLVDLKLTLIGTAVLCALFIGVRTYQQFFHRTAGIDAFSDEFQLYWVSVLYIAAIAEVLSFFLLVAYFWKTRDLDLANVEPREELRRIFHLLGWLFFYGVALYWGASYFSEQDAAWRDVAYRHSAYMHLNLIKVFVAAPLYIIVGIGAFMYAQTRVPTFASKGFSTAFVWLVFGPLLILPGFGFVEWGKTSWILDEMFVAPFNWPLVFFGWFALAVFGVTCLIHGRLLEFCSGYEDLFGIGTD
jgi:methane/ammonia monooxygenase subunit C